MTTMATAPTPSSGSDESDEQITCDNCGCYLSFSPVFLKETGKSICGNCNEENKHQTFRNLTFSTVFLKETGKSICGNCNEENKHQTFRNLTYEALAKSCNFAFPCRFKNNGCQEKHLWEEGKNHEEECIYRNYNCFINDCPWIGSKFNIKQHYEENHVENLLQLPCAVQPNIAVATDVKYLASSLENLFIVHVKYSVTTSVFSYNVCYLGKSNLSKYFNYNLEITSAQGNINMTKVVQPITEFHSAQKENVIEFNLNGLLSFGLISKYEECKFNLVVKLQNNECIKCGKELTVQNIIGNDCYCDNCNSLPIPTVTVPIVYNCSSCRSQYSSDNKEKHNSWMCVGYRKYYCCGEYLYSISKFEHDVVKHAPIENKFSTSPFSLKNLNVASEKFAVCTVFNAIFLIKFKYDTNTKNLECTVVSDLLKEDLEYFECTFKLSNQKTGYVTPMIKMNAEKSKGEYDWRGTQANEIKNSFIWHEYVLDKNVKKIDTKYNIEIKIEKTF